MTKRIVLFLQQQKISFSFLFIFSCLVLGLLLCFCCIAIYALSLQSSNAKTVLATLFMVTTSSYLVGNVLGFLFGIPKTIQEKHNGINSGSKISYQINTNLEQISDWLTKMLVGAGLIEFKDMVQFLKSISLKIAIDVGQASSESFVTASILCFIILGFFVTYLSTRLYIANALASANDALQGISAP